MGYVKSPPVERVFELEGTFDGPAARRIEAALQQADPSTCFHVDLTRVREFHDLGFAVLARILATQPGRVTLHGLRHHQIRLLRYLGADAEALDPSHHGVEAR
jgi:hypothetical protein